MHHKQEILEKLTGIQSSRKSYYRELNLVVDEMKKKNRQLEVINCLTKIKIDADWSEVSAYLAEQLSRLIPFDLFALTLVEGTSLSAYVAKRNGADWRVRTLTQSLKRGESVSTSALDRLFQTEHPGCHVHLRRAAKPAEQTVWLYHPASSATAARRRRASPPLSANCRTRRGVRGKHPPV